MKKLVLECENIGISFKGFTAVKNFNLKVQNEEIYGLIGPNGAGKSTVFNLLSGVYKPSSGKIIFSGKISRTFQNIRIFRKMTVLENLLVGLQNHVNYNLFETVFKLRRYSQQESRLKKLAFDLLSIMEMGSMANAVSENLPYGTKRKLEILRAITVKPDVLLLDEPAAGISKFEREDLIKYIFKIKNMFKISMILVEHDIDFVSKLCDKICVLNQGEIVANGLPEEIRNNQFVIDAYLGRKQC